VAGRDTVARDGFVPMSHGQRISPQDRSRRLEPRGNESQAVRQSPRTAVTARSWSGQCSASIPSWNDSWNELPLVRATREG
jgi:hypothetical protein